MQLLSHNICKRLAKKVSHTGSTSGDLLGANNAIGPSNGENHLVQGGSSGEKAADPGRSNDRHKAIVSRMLRKCNKAGSKFPEIGLNELKTTQNQHATPGFGVESPINQPSSIPTRLAIFPPKQAKIMHLY